MNGFPAVSGVPSGALAGTFFRDVSAKVPDKYSTKAFYLMFVYCCFVLFVFGLVFGSFGNAWAWRIAHNESIAKGRSHCAVCGHTLSAKDLIPLFSWIVLKGKCRYCGAPISKRYPLAELILGICFVSVFLRWGFTLDTLRYIILFFLLLVASLVDWEIMELPDGLLIAALAASLLRLPDWKGIVTGVFAISVPLLLIVLAMDRILGRESFGGGDIKLFAVIGAHFGAGMTLLILIVSCIVGIVFAVSTGKGKSNPFPFGPVIAISAWLCCIFGTPVINWYMSLL